MTLREHISEYAAQARTYKEHLWTVHKERELPPIVMAVFDGPGSGEVNPVSLPIAQLSGLLEDKVFSKGGQVGEWDDAHVAALHLAFQAALSNSLTTELPGVGMLGIIPVGLDLPTGAKLVAVLIMGESYVCPVNYKDSIQSTLEIDFKTNPNSPVGEAVMCVLIEDDLCGGSEWAMSLQDYAIDDGGRLTWDDDINALFSDTPSLSPGMRAQLERSNVQLGTAQQYIGREVGSS